MLNPAPATRPNLPSLQRELMRKLGIALVALAALTILMFLLGLKPFVRSAAQRDAGRLVDLEERRLARELGAIEDAGRTIAGLWTMGGLDPTRFATMQDMNSKVQELQAVTSLLMAHRDGTTYAFQKSGNGWVASYLHSLGAGASSICRLDAQGRPGKPAKTYYDAQARPWYQAGWKAGKAVWSAAYRDPEGFPCLSYSVPVWTLDHREMIGIVALDFRLEELSSLLEHTLPTDKSQALLVDEQDRVLAMAVGHGTLTAQARSYLYLQDRHRPEFHMFGRPEEAARPDAGEEQSSWWNPDQLVARRSFKACESLNWHQYLAIPKDELDFHVWDRVLPPLLALLTFFGVAVWLSNRAIMGLTQPLVDLANRVQHGPDEHVPPPGDTGTRELWILNDSVHRSWEARSQRRSLQEQVMQLERLQVAGTMTSGVAHDLGNFLTVAELCQEAAGDSLSPDSPAFEHVQAAQSATLRASALVRSLLNFCRNIQGEKEGIELVHLIDHLKPLLVSLVKGRLELRVDLPQSPLWVAGNGPQLEQVLVNLVVNARDAAPEDGLIRISLGGQDGWVEIRVEDDGTGIPPELLERIFEPFFTTKPVEQGTGLGLAMVKQIIENHGGHIQVQSQEGQGTRFSLTLPALDQA